MGKVEKNTGAATLNRHCTKDVFLPTARALIAK
jgi:hypothetical protein